MSENNLPALAQARQSVTQYTEAQLPTVKSGFFDLQAFELGQRVSKMFASSDLVPKQYQGNIANCMIALDMAQRIGANPLMLMQNLYIVHGIPSWSSKFLIATINACGRYSSLRYEWRGELGSIDYGCRAWAVERESGQRLDGIWVTWQMVKAEGWESKNGSKWKTMADQMFQYRAAAFWQRAYAPELGMGLQTAEEVIDMGRAPDGGWTMDTPTVALARPAAYIDRATGEITEPERIRRSKDELAADVPIELVPECRASGMTPAEFMGRRRLQATPAPEPTPAPTPMPTEVPSPQPTHQPTPTTAPLAAARGRASRFD